MKSIQGRLILTISAASVALLTSTAALLYHSIRLDLIRQVDRGLVEQASAVSSFVNVKSDGRLDFDYNESSIPAYANSRHAEYFVIRFPDGRVYAKSASLKHVPETALRLERDASPQDVTLPTGRTGRAALLDFVPKFDPDPEAGTRPPAPPAAAATGPMTIVVARDRASLDGALNHVLRRLMLGMTALAIAIALAVSAIVRRSLAPLRGISDCAARIEPSRLDLRLPGDGLPAELIPICSRVNDLLERLDAAFTRERRFTSDVAHELRTPIAELRAVVEVALRWPDEPRAAQDALRDAQHIAVQMQTLVATLLALVRSDRIPAPLLQPVRLEEAVAQSLRELDLIGRRKQISVQVPEDAVVPAEPALLASILRNVLSNADEYAEGDEPIRCRAFRRGRRWVLAVENCAMRLTEQDLPHLFRPFWRKDAARTDGAHVGLGLSLVSTYCRMIGVTIQATLPGGSTLRMELVFGEHAEPAPATESQASTSPTALAEDALAQVN